MLLEVEAGVARNEPVTYAVRKAIEKGVVELINEGAKKDLWEFDIPVVEITEKKVIDYTNNTEIGVHVDMGVVKEEKTYEEYLEEKKLKTEAAEEEWNQIDTDEEEQDEKTDNDSSDSGNPNQ